jgi:hypothetical protein
MNVRRPYATALERAVKAEADLAELREVADQALVAEGRITFAGMLWATGNGPTPSGVNDPRECIQPIPVAKEGSS